VAFGFPIDWVVTLPSQDVNGEDGTIQAGEYAKGDTATFFVLPNSGKVEVCALTFDYQLACRSSASDIFYSQTHLKNVILHLKT
jgi:sulfate adenylyltransferase subunit 1 (EFTu-like GTPase family)